MVCSEKTQVEVSLEYDNINNEGFHCDLHREAFHAIEMRIFSCCEPIYRPLPIPGDQHYVSNAGIELPDEEM